ncbi:hypothetical protein FJZ53_02355 [Candidatus Woesearchaeota archaeon]|nr:hypothetical protein [Candidatus Woesearchaeota archaeon]
MVLEVEKELGGILKDESSKSILLNGEAKELKQAMLSLVSYFLQTNKAIIFMTVDEPYAELDSRLKKMELETRKILFIDAISRPYSALESIGNCIFVNNPSNLTDMSIAVDGAMNALEDTGYVLIFDSLSVLTLYNHPQETLRFFHFLVSKIKASNTKGIFMFSGSKQKDLLEDMNQFCDLVKNV